MKNPKGGIVKLYEIFCGICLDWEGYHEEDSIEEVVDEAGKDGWVYTLENGWICPTCAEETRESKDKNDEQR